MSKYVPKTVLAEIDELIAEESYEDALDVIHDIEGAPSIWNTEIANRLEVLASHVDAAIFDLGSYWFEKKGAEAAEKARGYYARAAESDDPHVSGPANLALGLMAYQKTKNPDSADPYMKRAAELGYSQAQATWGMKLFGKSLESGDGTLAEEAMRFLQAAIDTGDLAEAKVFVAKGVLDGVIRGSKYDPMMLLSEASVQRNVEAMEMLMALAAPGGPDEVYDETLSYVVKPDGLRRPKLVRDAIAGEFRIQQSIAETITAGLYGCPSWARLSSVANDTRVPAGKFDEDLSAAEFNERRKAQAGVLLHYIEMPPHAADCAVELLLPTAGNGDKPSLRRLKERADRMTFKIGTNMPEPAGKKLFDKRGLQLDMDNAMRFAYRVQPEPWLEIMQDHLGWTVEETDYDRSGEGVLVARAPSPSGAFDVYMSRVSHRPGDQGDEYVEKLLGQISEKSERAILLFNIPIVFLRSQQKPEGILYGGKIKQASRPWRDFVFRPCEDGLEDALGQKLKFDDTAPRELLDTYGFEDAGRIALALTQMVKNEEDEDHAPVRMGGHEWSLFVSRDFREMLGRTTGRR